MSLLLASRRTVLSRSSIVELGKSLLANRAVHLLGSYFKSAVKFVKTDLGHRLGCRGRIQLGIVEAIPFRPLAKQVES